MTTTPESLAAAELAYQLAPVNASEPARLARLAAVRQAVADGWTHAAVAEAMGKSRGWVSQRATPSAKAAQPKPFTRAQIGNDVARRHANKAWRQQDPAAVRPRAIDRFRKD